MAELAERETDGRQHGDSSGGRKRGDGTAANGAVQRFERRLVERLHRAIARGLIVETGGARRRVQVFEVRGQLVDGVRRQPRGAALGRMPPDDLVPGLGSHRDYPVVLMPATRPSAAMNRAQSCRWAASTRRPLSVRR